MAQANNQKHASLTRRLRFTSKGGLYTAIFMSDRGDLYQQYIDTPNSSDADSFVPNFKNTKPILRATINNSNSTGVVAVDEYTYYVGGTKLSFAANGDCTTAGMAGKFKKTTDGLQIIDNIAGLFNGTSFDIKMEATIGNDTVVAVCPVSISKYVEGAGAKVTIAPDNSLGGNHNYTITDDVRRIGLKVLVLKDKVEYDAPAKINGQTVYYNWYRLTNGTWAQIAGASTGKLTVDADDVDTYTHFKVEVRLGSPTADLLGQDTQTVFDSSDPLDIAVSVRMSKDGTAASETSDYSEEFTDDMPGTAYIKYTCTLMRHNDQTGIMDPVTDAVTWKDAYCYNAAGLMLFVIKPTGNIYTVTVQDFLNAATTANASPSGDYDFFIEAEIN